jgi:hypothetical protein
MAIRKRLGTFPILRVPILRVPPSKMGLSPLLEQFSNRLSMAQYLAADRGISR